MDDITVVEWQGNYLRVRGEYITAPGKIFRIEELPPRTRRIRILRPLPPSGGGTTSAYAENTHVGEKPQVGARNYLRVRGEYDQQYIKHPTTWELPPRTRRIRG